MDDLEIGIRDYRYHEHRERKRSRSRSWQKTAITVDKKRRKRGTGAVGSAAVQPSLADPDKWRQQHVGKSGVGVLDFSKKNPTKQTKTKKCE